MFSNMQEEELYEVSGGGTWEVAVAIVGGLGAVLIKSFEAGRQFVKDIRNKFSD